MPDDSPGEVMTSEPYRLPATGTEWMTRTAVWARVIAVVSLIATTVVLMACDWDALGSPQCYFVCLFGGPAVTFLALSFLVRRMDGLVCLFIMALAVADAAALLASPLFIMTSHQTFLESMVNWLYLLVVVALAAGLGNLTVSAYWCRRWLRAPQAVSRVRGFEVLGLGADRTIEHQPIVSEREK
jgi:hypothetical protein